MGPSRIHGHNGPDRVYIPVAMPTTREALNLLGALGKSDSPLCRLPRGSGQKVNDTETKTNVKAQRQGIAMKVSRVAFGDGLRADAGFLTASWISTRGSTLQDKHTEDSCLPAFGSFLQPRRPVHDHVDRRYAGLFHWHWYEEAAVLAHLEICVGCEACVKQGLRRSPVEISLLP